MYNVNEGESENKILENPVYQEIDSGWLAKQGMLKHQN